MSGYLDSFGSLYFRPALSGTLSEWNTGSSFNSDASLIDDPVLFDYGNSTYDWLMWDNAGGETDYNKKKSWYCNTYYWGSNNFNSITTWLKLNQFNIASSRSGYIEVGIRPSGGTWQSQYLPIYYPQTFVTEDTGVFNWYNLNFDVQGNSNDSNWHTPEFYLMYTPSGWGMPVGLSVGDSLKVDVVYLEYRFNGLPLYISTMGTSSSGLNLFTQQYETLTSGIPLYGSVATNSELELPLMNKAEDPSGLNSNFPLFSKVYLESSGQIPFYTQGIPYDLWNYFPLVSSGDGKWEEPLKLYSLCIGDPWHYRPLYTMANPMVLTGVKMYASGWMNYADSGLQMFAMAPVQNTSGINFYVDGIYKTEKGVPLYSTSAEFSISGLLLYSNGIYKDLKQCTIFTYGKFFELSNQVSLTTKVSINGQAGVRDDDLGINLYVPVSGVKSTKGITLYSFNSGVPQSIFPLDRSITLFTSNPIDTYAEDGVPLVARNNTTGVYSGVPLLAKNYRTDISIFDPLYYELEDGGVPYSQGATLYTRQTLGEVGLPLYVGTGTQVVSGVVMFNQARSVGASIGGFSLWNSALAEFGYGVDFYGHGF